MHNVIFVTPGGEARVAFPKFLLQGVSDLWNSRDGEHWQQCKDEQGRVKHVVELQTENAQEVLDALQSAVFTGKLPACSYKVLMQVARLADAELMVDVVDLVKAALHKAALTGLQEQFPDDMTSIEATGHIPQLQGWVRSACYRLTARIVDNVNTEVITDLLTALPANSNAALGVLKEAWFKLLSGLPSYTMDDELKRNSEAILRHEQVLLANPEASFLTNATRHTYHATTKAFMLAMAHSYLGSPASALSSNKALNDFCNKFQRVSCDPSDLWDLYNDHHEKDFLQLLHKLLQHSTQADQYWYLCEEEVETLVGGRKGLNSFSASELRDVLLPVLRCVRAAETTISAVEVSADTRKHLHQEQQQKLQLQALQLWKQHQQLQQLVEQQQAAHQGQRRRAREQDDAGDAAAERRVRRRINIDEVGNAADQQQQQEQQQQQQQQQAAQAGMTQGREGQRHLSDSLLAAIMQCAEAQQQMVPAVALGLPGRHEADGQGGREEQGQGVMKQGLEFADIFAFDDDSLDILDDEEGSLNE